MKIFISVIFIKNTGGISRSLINLLGEISASDDITLCVLGNYISGDVELPPNVTIINGSNSIRNMYLDRELLRLEDGCSLPKILSARLQRRLLDSKMLVKKAASKVSVPGEYDVAIAFSNDIYDANGRFVAGGVSDFVLNSVRAKRKIAWIHNDALKCGLTRDKSIELFSSYDAIVHVSLNNKEVFDGVCPELACKSHVVYNMYDYASILSKASQCPSPYLHSRKALHFVTVARIRNEQKRIDRIVDAASILNKKGYASFDWYIVGDGEDRAVLESLVVERGLTDTVIFVGHKSNPFPYMKNANLFVLTSQYEGFGMSVLEARALGCPAVITDFGPSREVIQDRVNGLICSNDTQGIVAALQEVMDNKSILSLLRENIENNPSSNSLALKQFSCVCRGEDLK